MRRSRFSSTPLLLLLLLLLPPPPPLKAATAAGPCTNNKQHNKNSSSNGERRLQLGQTTPTSSDDAQALLSAFFVPRSSGADVFAAWQSLHWNESTDPCDSNSSWAGVTCNGGRVTKVDFHSLPQGGALQFILGPEIAHLTALTYLSTSNTGMKGYLPAALGQMPMMQRLYMHTIPTLSGTIPDELFEMVSLTKLSLYDTGLSGTFSEHIGKLTHLQGLYADGLKLSGTIPSQISNAAALAKIYLGETRDTSEKSSLSGTLPPSMSTMASLSVFSMPGSHLSGTFPAEFKALHQLSIIKLFNTDLSGTFPGLAAVGLKSLQEVDVHSAQLVALSSSLNGCSSLVTLDATNNSLRSLPVSLPPSLTHIYLNENPLNVTMERLALVLHKINRVHSLELSATNIPVVLAWQPHSPPLCNVDGVLHGCRGTRVETPNNCRVGLGAPPCSFLLHIYDSDDQALRSGGQLQAMELMINNTAARTPMHDNRDGTFLATIPAVWIQTKGEYLFHFLHLGVEFQPFQIPPMAYGTDPDCHAPTFGPCQSIRIVKFGERKCPKYSQVDEATGTLCSCQHGYGPDVDFSQENPACHLMCPEGTRTSIDDSHCECVDHRYNTSGLALLCGSTPWIPPEMLTSFKDVQNDWVLGRQCSACPECAVCKTSGVQLKAGWRTITHIRINDGDSFRSSATYLIAVRCPFSTCPQVPIELANNTCSGNHTGILCALCPPGFSEKGSDSGECIPCTPEQDLGISLWGFLALVAVIFLSAAAFMCTQQAQVERIKVEVFTNFRILLGAAQVLSLIPGVLNLVFPQNVRVAMGLASVVVANLGSLLNFHCLGIDWFTKWLLIVGVVPVGVLPLMFLRWMWACFRFNPDESSLSRTLSNQTNIRKSLAMLLFSALLLYPQVSTAIFSALRCRKLTTTVSVLEEDYSVSCESAQYKLYKVAATTLVWIWIIGIPAGLPVTYVIQWFKNRKLWLATQQNDTLAEYNFYRVRRIFGFCVDDYKPETFWFEPVDLLRKVSLSGLLQFAKPGTTEQVFFGCWLAFLSFGFQLYIQPYREPESNLLKTLVDAQIFLTFLVSFILRVFPYITDLDPALPKSFYGLILLISVILLVLATAGLTVKQIRRHRSFRRRIVRLSSDGSHNRSIVFSNDESMTTALAEMTNTSSLSSIESDRFSPPASPSCSQSAEIFSLDLDAVADSMSFTLDDS
eukprot:COSAG05_NODE_551_length_8736_cov_5.409401_1_plen_1202_part_00